MTDQLHNNKVICEGTWTNMESIYVFLHLSSLVRIEPELYHNDCPTYTTLPYQPRVWERQSNKRITCLVSFQHTG
jgi:hypothetical protein